MGYLSNVSITCEEQCEYAAKESGMNVEFRTHPIPKDPHNPDDKFYFPESLEGICGSIYTNEGYVDHSSFWKAWDEYEKSPNFPQYNT